MAVRKRIILLQRRTLLFSGVSTGGHSLSGYSWFSRRRRYLRYFHTDSSLPGGLHGASYIEQLPSRAFPLGHSLSDTPPPERFLRYSPFSIPSQAFPSLAL